jgi:hypothetical protein
MSEPHIVRPTRRERLARIVLLVAAMATIATSAPQDDLLEDDRELWLEAPDVGRFRLELSAAAVAQADGAQLELSLENGAESVVVVPDDEALGEVIELSTQIEHIFFDPSELCPSDEACELGFTVDAQGLGSVAVGVSVRMHRKADGRLLCPRDDDFSDGATMEIVEDE